MFVAETGLRTNEWDALERSDIDLAACGRLRGMKIAGYLQDSDSGGVHRHP